MMSWDLVGCRGMSGSVRGVRATWGVTVMGIVGRRRGLGPEGVYCGAMWRVVAL